MFILQSKHFTDRIAFLHSVPTKSMILKFFAFIYTHTHTCMCMCAHVCVHAIACVWRSGEPALSSHLWAPGMEFRSSVLVAGIFTHWTVSPTQSAILELEGRLEWESTWLFCKAVYGVTHGKAGNKHYSTLPLSDSKPVWAHCPKFNGIFQPMRRLKSLGGNLPGGGGLSWASNSNHSVS